MPSILLPEALTTLDSLKSALSITNTSKDADLEKLINRATAWIESRTDRKLKARQYNGLTGGVTVLGVHPTTSVPDEDYLYLSGSLREDGGDAMIDEGGAFFHLPSPIQANSVLPFQLAVLSNRASTLSGGETWDTTSHVEWDTFVVDRRAGVLRSLGGPWASGYRNFRVKCAAGYQTGSNQPFVPADLEDLCIQVCKKLYRENPGLQSESIGSLSRTYNVDKQNELINETLSLYTRYAFA